MYSIETNEPSEEFSRCWFSAAKHLNTMSQKGLQSWLKIDLTAPFLEHISFRMGNQLFFIRVVDVEGQVESPGNPTGVEHIADGCKGFACLMPMRRHAGEWLPDEPRWGLLDVRSGQPIDPVAYVSDEKIEMTDWELQDFAVQVVRDYVGNSLNFQLMSWQGNPDVDPSIWFDGGHGPEWVVVRAVRYPEKEAALPHHIKEIANSCSHLSNTGHFASVSVANKNNIFDTSDDVQALPLWRGHKMNVRFEGLTSPSLN
jgi:hypothetical protein